MIQQWGLAWAPARLSRNPRGQKDNPRMLKKRLRTSNSLDTKLQALQDGTEPEKRSTLFNSGVVIFENGLQKIQQALCSGVPFAISDRVAFFRQNGKVVFSPSVLLLRKLLATLALFLFRIILFQKRHTLAIFAVMFGRASNNWRCILQQATTGVRRSGGSYHIR